MFCIKSMRQLIQCVNIIRKSMIYIILSILAIFFCFPFILLFIGSLTSKYELRQALLPLMANLKEWIDFPVIPHYPTLEHFQKALILSPQFLTVFWNSVKIVFCILFGQLLIAVPSAWAFGVYKFRCRKFLFTIYVILMLLPFQVTMLSQYLVLDRLSLVNTQAAVILPAVFSTFPVFLMYQGFRQIPEGLLDAARVDGAGDFMIFWRIGLPLGRSGILAAMVLGFLEYWNLVEQPLTFLEDKTLWPLSIYLPQIDLSQAGYAFAACVIAILPAGFVFLLGEEYLEEGIAASGLKE